VEAHHAGDVGAASEVGIWLAWFRPVASLQFNDFVCGAGTRQSEGEGVMSHATASGTIVNGVDVDVLEGTAEAVKQNSDLARCKFRLRNRWIRGGHGRSTLGSRRANLCWSRWC
jgi:hypothetical protein